MFCFHVPSHVTLEHIHTIFQSKSIQTFADNCISIIDTITLFPSHYFCFSSNNCWSKPSYKIDILRSGEVMSSDCSWNFRKHAQQRLQNSLTIERGCEQNCLSVDIMIKRCVSIDIAIDELLLEYWYLEYWNRSNATRCLSIEIDRRLRDGWVLTRCLSIDIAIDRN